MTSIPGGGDRDQAEASAAGGRTTRAFSALGGRTTRAFSAFRSVWRRTAARGADRRVALDIGSSSVKLLEMRGSGEAAEVLRAGAAPVPEGALRSNAVADVVAVSAVIRQLAGRLGVTARRAVTAVPGPAVIVERMRLPLRPEDDLETVLMIEAASFIPESLDNVSLDYQVLRADQDAAEVLVVAVRKDILAGFTRAITDAGLEPTVVDVDCFALESMFERNYETGPEDVVALINVGARYSTIAVVKGGRSVAVGDVQAGGASIVEALVEATGASCADAGGALGREAAALDRREAAVLERREAAVSDRPEAAPPERGASLQRVVSTRVAELADAIEETLRFLWRTASGEPLRALYLSGGGARIAGLGERLAARVGAPVEIANPLARVRVSREVDAAYLEALAPTLAVAVGLGIRRVDDA